MPNNGSTDAQATPADHALAHSIAEGAAELLMSLQGEQLAKGIDHYSIERAGDSAAHRWIVDELNAARPEDALLSEEGVDDQSRVGNARAWIIDPLDGSSSFGRGSREWAVHVALVENGIPVAGAVAAPGIGVVASSHQVAEVRRENRTSPIVVTGRTRAHSDGLLINEAIGADIYPCSSAGFKAALVTTGRADVYVHDSPLYEWDVCAPAAMAIAAGFDVSDPWGEPLVFNQARPVVPGLVVSAPAFTRAVLEALAVRRAAGSNG